MPRPEPLADLLDAARRGLDAALPAGAPGRPVADRIFAALEQPAPARPCRRGEPPAGLAHLDRALANAIAHGGAVAAAATALGTLAPSLDWRRRAGSAALSAAFHDGHANAIVVGPEGLERRRDVVVGVSLLAPHVRYPDHHHPPEELYAVLSEGEWYRESRGWYRPGIGAAVHHEPSVVHAMRSGPEPLLAIWLLFTGEDGVQP